jgi:hypothetical protein
MRFDGRLAALVLLVPAFARAERPPGVCVEVGVDFTPTDALQIVAWLEKPDGTFVDTIYITQKTGRFGLGNRPGRSDFNTGSLIGDTFPYGRREQTFPVWAHRHGKTFPRVVFQNGDENNLSHPFSQSSPEAPPPYCRPIQPTEDQFDSGTCASAAFTDKGVFAPGGDVSRYPPRSDLKRRPEDSASVELYRAYNPFDAVTRATPPGGVPASAIWAAPQSVDFGDYVLFVETSKTYDFNATYNETTYPPPNVQWSSYGKPWRGQPSIVYRVPFSIATTQTVASTDTYVGYGDITGATGTLHPPDATITTTTPGSGASRMQLVSDGSAMYRVRVRAKPETDPTPPAAVTAPTVANVTGTSATIAFVASGDDGGDTGTLAGYEIRLRAGEPITEANFDESMPLGTSVAPVAPGSEQTVEINGLLPETDYWIGIRPYDNCYNRGPLTVVQATTLDRPVAEVDWCFVATAAYGSRLASDVALLRHFRDSLLATNVLGELAIETYYTFGPAAAGVIGESELLRASVRTVLGPIITWIRGLAY